MLLFELCSDTTYWPEGYTNENIVECLRTPGMLPHERLPEMLELAERNTPSKGLTDVVVKMLDRNPHNRPNTAKLLAILMRASASVQTFQNDHDGNHDSETKILTL